VNPRTKIAVTIFCALSALCVVGAVGTIGPSVSTAPSPAELFAAPVSGIVTGSPVWVQWQGWWYYQAACPCTPNGVTCGGVAGGDGGTGQACWQRGNEGFPGAGAVALWWADSVSGDDANDCQAPGASPTGPGGHGACATPWEVFRRARTLSVSPIVYLAGDYAGFSGEIDGPPSSAPYKFFNLVGTQTTTGADGGAFYQGQITAFVPWNSAAHQEGYITVGPLDGGVAFDPTAFPSTLGYVLQDTSRCSSGHCLGLNIGPVADAGTFATAGGTLGASVTQPAVGDAVQVATLTAIGTAPAAQVLFGGTGVALTNVQVGSGTHSVVVEPLAGADYGFECFSCLINGLDLMNGAWAYLYGDTLIGTEHLYGHAIAAACSWDNIEVRQGGMLSLTTQNLVTGQSVLQAGTRDGPGYVLVNGSTAIVNYDATAGLWLTDGSYAHLAGYFWCRNAIGTTPCIKTQTGSVVVYDVPPAAVGVAAANPWVAGGVAASSLPLLTAGSLTGILVNQ
jgi:hypothetical protein